MATPILAGSAPAPLNAADRAAEILGNVGDVRAMLQGVCAILASITDRRTGLEEAERLLLIAQSRVAETYQAAESLTADLDNNVVEVAHG